MNGSYVRLFIGQRLIPQNEVPAPARECAEPARVPEEDPE